MRSPTSKPSTGPMPIGCGVRSTPSPATARSPAMRSPRHTPRSFAVARRFETLQPGSRESGIVPVDAAGTDRHVDQDLLNALGRLPDGQRAAVILFYYADLPVRQIAD